jgi:hypothetical protein
LLHSVQTGETAFDSLYRASTWDWFADHPAAARLFDRQMDELTSAEAIAVAAVIDVAGVRTVVDVAGGRGILLAEILRRNPSARGILFNLAAVVDSARHVLDADVAPRVDLVAGSFFESIPSGGDLYILKNILHDWSDDRSVAILQACRRAMTDASRLLIIEHLVSAPNQPGFGKVSDIQMMVRTAAGTGRSKSSATC